MGESCRMTVSVSGMKMMGERFAGEKIVAWIRVKSRGSASSYQSEE